MARDAHGRRIDYLRISVTDRCNLRCIYCMPEEGVEWKPVSEILTYEEIERFAAAAVSVGITKIRLTGGEPLVRKGLVDHIRRLKDLTGLEAIALTTNGTLLEQNVASLREAGLSRVNVSLDSLDPEVYATITRGGDLNDALAGLSAALDEGFSPVKVNVVVVRSLNQDLGAFARHGHRPAVARALHRVHAGRRRGSRGRARTRWRLDRGGPRSCRGDPRRSRLGHDGPRDGGARGDASLGRAGGLGTGALLHRRGRPGHARRDLAALAALLRRTATGCV